MANDPHHIPLGRGFKLVPELQLTLNEAWAFDEVGFQLELPTRPVGLGWRPTVNQTCRHTTLWMRFVVAVPEDDGAPNDYPLPPLPAL